MDPRAHSTRARAARCILLCLSLGLLLGLLPSTAAHAALISADPPRNSQLDVAPSELLLGFSEPYENDYTRVRVVDEADRRYDLDNLFEDGNTRIRVPLDEMPDGLYFVHWRTLGRDTHVLSGQYLLAINVTFDESSVPHEGGGGDGVPEEGFGAEVAVRTIGFLAGSLTAGISLFVLVLPRGDPLDVARRGHHRLTAVAGLAAALAGLLLLVVLAQRIDSTVLAAAQTETGAWIALRILAFSLAATTAALTARWSAGIRIDDAVTAAFGVGGLLATTMSSHAAGETSLRGLAISVDFLHLVAVAFWLGGLVLLSFLMFQHAAPSVLHAAVRRFSPLAVASVIGIVLTGAVASGLRILGPTDLVETVYGRALLLKILLLAPLVGFGVFNRYFVQPRLALTDASKAVGALRKSVLGEVVIMIVVLVAAATLATVAPPDVLGRDGGGDGPSIDQYRGIVTTFEVGGIGFTVRALPDPLKVGPQNITVETKRLDGSTAEVRDIILILRSPDEGAEAEGDPVPFERIDDDTWRISGFVMSSAGVWHNDIAVQGKGLPYHEEHVPMIVE